MHRPRLQLILHLFLYAAKYRGSWAAQTRDKIILSQLTSRQSHAKHLSAKKKVHFRSPLWDLRGGESMNGHVSDASKALPTNISPKSTKFPALPPSIRVLYAASFLFILSGSMVSLAPAQALIRMTSSNGGGAESATTLLSLIATGSALLEVTSSAALGSALDRVGRKPALLLLVSVVAATYAGTAVCPGVMTVCLSRFVGMITMGFFTLTTQTVISDLVGQVTTSADDSSIRSGLVSSAVGVQMALVGVGFLLGIICAGQLTERGLFVVYGVASVISALAVALIQFAFPETLPSTVVSTPREKASSSSSLLEALTSCTRLLTRHGPRVRTLGILLMLMNFPAWMGDTFQVFTKSEWNLSSQQLSLYLALYSGFGIISNIIGSALVQRIGVKKFTCLALVSRIISTSGVVFFGFQGSLVTMVIGFLGNAAAIGVIAALVSEGAQSGLPQGELAGERASLTALLKVVGPILYSTLFVQGQKLFGTSKIPFIFNVGIFTVALIGSASRL